MAAVDHSPCFAEKLSPTGGGGNIKKSNNNKIKKKVSAAEKEQSTLHPNRYFYHPTRAVLWPYKNVCVVFCVWGDGINFLRRS
jgi:hypothetical protein